MATRRWLSQVPVVLGFACVLGTACAQDRFPAQPITLVLPAGVGTGVDVVGRIGAQKLGERLKQTVIVENVVGASGVNGVQRVTRAKPEGNTLLELAPVSRFAASPFVWLVNVQVPVRTFSEFVAYAQANPGKLAMGVSGLAPATYMASQLLARQTGAEILPVPYAGSFSADLISNVVQVSMSPAASVPALLGRGKVRALAQTGERRSTAVPDAPAVSETLPGHVIDAWYAVWTPAESATILSDAWKKAASMPDVAERLEGVAAVAIGSTAAELSALIRSETKMWGDVVKARDIKPAQ